MMSEDGEGISVWGVWGCFLEEVAFGKGLGRDDRRYLGWCLWSEESVNKSREMGRPHSNESFWVELRVSKDHKDKGKKVG